MLIDVGDPLRNIILNACFYILLVLGVVALVPWKGLGAARLSRLLRFLPLPSVAVAITYEVAMPASYDIRVDLLLLLPIYCVIILTSAWRWFFWRRAERRE